MENIVSKYQSRSRKRSTGFIVMTSLGLAVLANVFAFSQVGQQLKASVLEAGSAPAASAAADVYLASNPSSPDVVELKAGKNMAQVKELSFSLAMDPSLVDLKNVTAGNPAKASVTLITSQAPFVATLRFAAPADVRAGDVLARVIVSKKRPVASPINLTATFFKSDKTYELSPAGLASY